MPNGKLYLGHVKWASGNNHTLLFENKNARDEFLKSHLQLITSSFTWVSPNTSVKVDSSIKGIENINYAYYIPDDSVTNQAFCCFVTSFEYSAPKTTILNLKLDTMQQYIYDITFFDSFVERSHISKSNDTIGRWVAPEPVSFPATISVRLGDSALSWSPAWNINTVSVFGVGVGSQLPFYYGGYGIGTSNATGGYSFPLNLMNNIEDFIKIYRDTEILQKTHLDEIINLNCVPQWIETNAINNGIIGLDTHNEYKVYKSNPLIAGSEHILSYNPRTLACGYTPRNNKMFTSLAKTLVIHNKNGLSIPLRPELFEDSVLNGSDSPILYYICKPLNMNSIKCDVLNYRSPDSEFFIPYGATLGIGYNSNQGIAGFMNKLTAIGGITALAGGTLMNGATGALSISAYDTITNMTSGMNATSSAIGVVGAFAKGVDAFDSQYTQLGSCTDTTSVSATFVAPEFWDKSPTTEQCRIIDDYLDKFGYALNEIVNIKNYINNRSNWNFIKTNDIQFVVDAPKDYTDELRSMFDSGYTFWHTYANYGDYSKTNT